jgi:4-amino-4-deoxy-L-arabinose transferase-like glycosyltransferase
MGLPRSPIIDYAARAFWLAAIGLAYLAGLDMPLLGPDEPRYAQVGREMFERGDLITPTLGGFPWLEKPVLLYWLQIAAYSIFGVSEFSARIGTALCGLGSVGVVWLLGKSVELEAGQSEGIAKHKLAHTMALMTASSLGLLAFSHGATFDILITFTVTASLASFFVFEECRSLSARVRYGALISFYVFLGFGLLAKGLIGLFFPASVAAIYLLVARKRPDRVLLASAAWGMALTALIAGSWYLPMYLRQGGRFIDEFIIQHHFQRFTSNKYLHPQPFYFFFWVLPLMALPWLPLFIKSFPRAIADGVRSVRGFAVKTALVERLNLFSAVGVAVPLIFFSFSGSKLPGYILPAVPAAAVMATISAARLGRFRWLVPTAAAAVLVGSFIALIFVVPYATGELSTKRLLESAAKRGYVFERVLTLHTISHNAEFYAAGRLVRDDLGRQVKMPGTSEIREYIQKNGGRPVLVLVTPQYLDELLTSPYVSAQLLDNNGQMAIAYVTVDG